MLAVTDGSHAIPRLSELQKNSVVFEGPACFWDEY